MTQPNWKLWEKCKKEMALVDTEQAKENWKTYLEMCKKDRPSSSEEQDASFDSLIGDIEREDIPPEFEVNERRRKRWIKPTHRKNRIKPLHQHRKQKLKI